jgi:hypothetical protein
MKLNFTLSELIHSDTAVKYNINNMPDINALDNLLDLIVYCLQPIRDKLGKPIVITNGYRSFALWKKLDELGYKPSKKSQHLEGKAVDIKINGISQEALFYLVKECGVEYDQLIWEKDNNCVHISYNKGKNRKHTLIREKNFTYIQL